MSEKCVWIVPKLEILWVVHGAERDYGQLATQGLIDSAGVKPVWRHNEQTFAIEEAACPEFGAERRPFKRFERWVGLRGEHRKEQPSITSHCVADNEECQSDQHYGRARR